MAPGDRVAQRVESLRTIFERAVGGDMAEQLPDGRVRLGRATDEMADRFIEREPPFFNAATSRSNRSTRSKSSSKGVRSIASAARTTAFQARRSHVHSSLHSSRSIVLSLLVAASRRI